MEIKIFIENDLLCSFWECENCKEEVKCCANKIYYLRRNLKNKKICKKCSLKKQLGVNNPFFNKKHSVETISKISKSKTGISTSKHMSTIKYKQMFSKMKKNLWDSGKMELVRKKLSKLMKERISNGGMKGYNRSKAEDEIINELNKFGIETEANFIIDGKVYDIYIKKLNLIIEYNGDYWHCNPFKYESTYFNKKKNKFAKEIWEYDKNKIDLAINNNYDCQVIWESDYKMNKKEIIKKIIEKHDNKKN